MDRELAFLLAMQPGLAKADRYWWLIFDYNYLEQEI